MQNFSEFLFPPSGAPSARPLKPKKTPPEDRFPPRAEPVGTPKHQLYSTPLRKNSKYPLVYWGKGWFFFGMKNDHWAALTAKSRQPFPIQAKNTHPGYVLEEVGDCLVSLCPCSSHCWDRPKAWIPKGAELTPTGYVMDRDTYILVRSAVQVPRKGEWRGARFMGIFPPEKLSRGK